MTKTYNPKAAAVLGLEYFGTQGGDSTLQAEDEIIAVASSEGAQMLADLLSYPVYPTRNGAKKE